MISSLASEIDTAHLFRAASLLLAAFTSSSLAADELEQMSFDQPTRLWLAAESETVQQALDLSKQQQKKLESMWKELESGAEKAKREAELAQILNDRQFARLQQIAWQVRPDEALQSEQVAKRLNLSRQQQQSIAEIWKEGEAGLIADLRRIRFRSPEDRNRFIRKHIHSTADKMLNVLSGKQRAQFEELLGTRLEWDQGKPDAERQRP
jgi:hypothetical protein